MKPRDAPKLERRRATDFERELLTRARTWIPSWSAEEDQADFGLALMKIVARFNSEVAERLDKSGEKMALGFLDWLGLPATAARPARMPVVLKMAETAREPVMAPRPVKMQVDVGDATVTFETETDLQVIPGQLAAVVAVDPAADAYYLPPPGFTGLAKPEPLPTAWTLKNFAAPGARTLQLDPGLGLTEGMLVDIAGEQFRIAKAKDDLVTIDPAVPAGDGLAGETAVAKVERFRPFDGARNLQDHILYIGDSDALNIEAEALVEVRGLGAMPDRVEWEYWGKASDDADAEAAWLNLPVSGSPPGRLILAKPKGELEETDIGAASGRWIRARLKLSERMIKADLLDLKINPSDVANTPAPPPIDLFVNATASTNRNFFLFGQEPRLFDTLYVGCAEAFSKAGANATVEFDLSDGAFGALTAFTAGSKLGVVLAGVDKDGSLQIFSIAADGKLKRLNDREPLKPEPRDAAEAGASNFILTSSDLRPCLWLAGDALVIAVAAKGEVWVRVETPQYDIPLPFGATFTFPALGRWEYWGSPGGDADDAVSGMAVVNLAGVPALVVMTEAGLLQRKSAAGAEWQDQPLPLPANDTLKSIAAIRSASNLKAADNFLAVSEDSPGGPYRVRLGPAATTAIQNINPDIPPFGFESGATTTVIAVKRNPARLVAVRNGVDVEVELGDVDLGTATFDGSDQGGALTIYGSGTLHGRPVLVSWTPYDPVAPDVLLVTHIEVLIEAPKGPVAVLGDRLFLPGDRKGAVLTATDQSPDPFSAPAAMFRSAVAISSSAVLPAAMDRIAVLVNDAPVDAGRDGSPTGGIGAFAGSTFLWLDKRIDRDTDEDDIFIFPPAANPLPTGTVDSHTATQTTVDLGQPVADGMVLLVENTQGPGENLVRIVSITGNVATVEPPLSAQDGDSVDYRVAEKFSGRVFPSLELDNSNNGIDLARTLANGINFAGLDPQRQQVIAVAETGATPVPQFLALEFEWATGPGGAAVDFYLANTSAWDQARAATSATAVIAWEYWDGTSWSVLDLSEDSTSHLRQSGSIQFIVPRDLEPVDWAGKTSHWIRARLIGGNYGEAKVEVVTQQNGTTSTQTVKRSTDDLQPPYALSVSVTYSLDKGLVPQFLLTHDSGSARDQSDANRTPGAEVEIFTPLAVALGRLDAPIGDTQQSKQCLADCSCDTGTPSMSPKVSGAPESASDGVASSGSGRRAIYLGFTSKLFGQPARLLFNVERESDYDSIGPLSVDALVGDRFAPIVSSDDTRGLGETGLLTMAFDVAPRKAELFGQALSWLRLTPRVGSDEWKPSLAGAYPNGVWARAAETMTRELLGSSDGRPLLTVTLARPPLLHGTLELRIREPLGEEERMALTREDANLVNSAVTDLRGHWVLWKQVFDPADCGPKDRVYSLEEATGDVRFGDGLHGMIPPVGVDAIVAFAYERTEPIAGGRLAANFVPSRTELNLVTPVESVESVIAADQSAGGVAPETGKRVLQFAPSRLRHRDRAVSLRDFEDLVLQKFDEVVQARAFGRNGRVRLVVVTKSASRSPSRAQQRELRRTLLDIAPPALGIRDALTITGPRVRRLRASLDLRVMSLDVGGRVAGEAKARLVAAFDPASGWLLGRTPREEDVAEALIDIASLDGIVSIALFELDEAGSARPWRGSVGADHLVLLAPEDVRVGFDVMGAAA